MKELVTAKRLGHTTDLKWITLVDGKIQNVIKENGKEIQIHEIGELLHSYDPVAPISMFKDYFDSRALQQELKGSSNMKESASKKKQPASKPTSERPKVPNKKTQKAIKEIEDGKGVSVGSVDELFDEKTVNVSETFNNTIETTLVLEIYKPDGELFYSIEFEDEEDFAYHLRKKKEKFPYCKFVRKTMRSMVSYVEL